MFVLTLPRSSLACYYRAMMEELIANVKQTHSEPLKRTDSPEVMLEHCYFIRLSSVIPLTYR